MCGKKSEIALSIRNLIISNWKDGATVRKIGEILNISKTTVHNIIVKYRNTKTVENKPRSGCPKILDEREERWNVRQIIQDHKKSAVKLTLESEKGFRKSANPETVRNLLRRNNFNGRVPRRKPLISKAYRKARLKFALEYINKTEDFWNTVIFTDESKYNIFGSDGKQKVWRKPNTELQLKNLRATVKHGGGNQMFWGCMASSGVGNLHFIDGKMDKFAYLDILKGNLKESAQKLGILNKFKLYQDNYPRHTADICKLWVLYNCPSILKTSAQSPDINPIEHLWDHL